MSFGWAVNARTGESALKARGRRLLEAYILLGVKLETRRSHKNGDPI